MSYLNKGLFNTSLHTHHLVLLSLLPRFVMSGKMEGSIRAQVFQSSSHQLLIGAIAYNGLWFL